MFVQSPKTKDCCDKWEVVYLIAYYKAIIKLTRPGALTSSSAGVAVYGLISRAHVVSSPLLLLASPLSICLEFLGGFIDMLPPTPPPSAAPQIALPSFDMAVDWRFVWILFCSYLSICRLDTRLQLTVHLQAGCLSAANYPSAGWMLVCILSGSCLADVCMRLAMP